jgi:hypothetical protein
VRRSRGVVEALVDAEADPRAAFLDDLEPRFEQIVDRRRRVKRFERPEM